MLWLTRETGLSIRRTLRSRRPGRNRPVVMLSTAGRTAALQERCSGPVKAPHGTPALTRSWSSANACGIAVNRGVLLCLLPKVIMGAAERHATTSLCFVSCRVARAFPFGPKRSKCVELVHTLAAGPQSRNVPRLVLTWPRSVTLCLWSSSLSSWHATALSEEAYEKWGAESDCWG